MYVVITAVVNCRHVYLVEWLRRHFLRSLNVPLFSSQLVSSVRWSAPSPLVNCVGARRLFTDSAWSIDLGAIHLFRTRSLASPHFVSSSCCRNNSSCRLVTRYRNLCTSVRTTLKFRLRQQRKFLPLSDFLLTRFYFKFSIFKREIIKLDAM